MRTRRAVREQVDCDAAPYIRDALGHVAPQVTVHEHAVHEQGDRARPREAGHVGRRQPPRLRGVALDDEVLRNVKRQTIKMQAYEQLRVYVRGRGLRSNTDLILGLPGETLASHMTDRQTSAALAVHLLLPR